MGYGFQNDRWQRWTWGSPPQAPSSAPTYHGGGGGGSKKGAAVTALVVSIFGICPGLGAIGAVLGLFALLGTRRGDEGRGMAVAAIVIGLLWTAFYLIPLLGR